MNNIKKVPEKGDVISLRGCCGTSPRTIWTVLTHIDKNGMAKMKSKGGKVKTILLDVGKLTGNPIVQDDFSKKIKWHNNV